jgi:hypothetical protein
VFGGAVGNERYACNLVTCEYGWAHTNILMRNIDHETVGASPSISA